MASVRVAGSGYCKEPSLGLGCLCVSVLNRPWLGKSWGLSKTPYPHSLAVRGPTDSIPDTVVTTYSGPGVESDICGPQDLSSIPPYKT